MNAISQLWQPSYTWFSYATWVHHGFNLKKNLLNVYKSIFIVWEWELHRHIYIHILSIFKNYNQKRENDAFISCIITDQDDKNVQVSLG
jgi:hypothetical protein